MVIRPLVEPVFTAVDDFAGILHRLTEIFFLHFIIGTGY